MFRLASFTVLLALVSQAHGQSPSTGIPASVVSPTADGRHQGIPASVVSPKPPVQGVHRPNQFVVSSRRPLRPFGTRRGRTVLVPVPLFYPAYGQFYPLYGQTYDPESAAGNVADPAVPAASDPAASAENDNAIAENEDALRRAYLQGARDALAQQSDRYGQHYFDSRESGRSKPLTQKSPEPAPAAAVAADDWPSTVFIFKDGHQLETRNFAIMGQTLYDFTSSGLKKVELSDLDTAATQKANNDRGITVKLQ